MPPASDFKVETLSTDALGNPMDIAIAPDLKVYWVERYGQLKVYDPVSGSTRLIKRFDVMYSASGLNYLGGMETGLQGIALDPQFATHHWVYLWYSLPANRLTTAVTGGKPGPTERLSRFTLSPDHNQVDMASEKVIFEHQVFAQCCHYGGDLDWGPDGNLWLTTGDNMQWTLSTDDPFREENENTDVRRTAGNTQDTRGKILRIKPIPFPDSQTPPPGIGSTYTIPAGNMREHFAKQGFWSAAETSLVRPEIFSMGHRNPFTMALHPLRHYPAIGEAGWDNATNGEDEINLVTKPQNNGWPFFNGGNYTGTQNASLNPKQNASAPLNLSKWNTGVQKLPPAIPAALSNRTATVKANLACLGTVLAWAHTPTGPEAKVKFPAYLEGKLLFSSYGGVPLQAATVDDSGRITRVEQVLPARSELTFIFRAEPGPDGAIYIARGQNEYGTAPTPEARIVKLSYVGSCAPVATRPFARTFKSPTNRGLWLFQPGQIASLPWPEGATSVRAYDMHGAMLWESKRFGASTLSGSSANALGKHRPGLVRLRFFGEALQSASALQSATQD